MRRWMILAGLVAAAAAGLLASGLAAEEARPKPKTPPAADKAAPSAPDKAAPPSPAKPAPRKEPRVNPPPPVPDVVIPPIPQVGTDPFRPAGDGDSAIPGATAGYAPGPGDVLIEEGKRLFSREGRLDLDAVGRTVFVFDSGDKPMRLLENSLREYLEAVTQRGKKAARWRVSGLVTTYQRDNFLLLTKVVRILPEEEEL